MISTGLGGLPSPSSDFGTMISSSFNNVGRRSLAGELVLYKDKLFGRLDFHDGELAPEVRFANMPESGREVRDGEVVGDSKRVRVFWKKVAEAGLIVGGETWDDRRGRRDGEFVVESVFEDAELDNLFRVGEAEISIFSGDCDW
jgi:hypothetical protein